MRRWILTVCVAAAAVALLLIIALWNVGPLIKQAVNTYGPAMTKTDVWVKEVHVSLLSGKGKLGDFYLGNPKGFTTPDAIKVSSVYVDVDGTSLAADTIVINEIEFLHPEITFEKVAGSDNFHTIIENMKNGMGNREIGEGQSKQEGRTKKILIRNFIVKEGKVNLLLPSSNGKIMTVLLPDIHLKDVGKEKGGAAPAEVFGQLLTALCGELTSPGLADLLNQRLGTPGGGISSAKGTAPKRLGTSRGWFGK